MQICRILRKNEVIKELYCGQHKLILAGNKTLVAF